jgi:hypothetical protein
MSEALETLYFPAVLMCIFQSPDSFLGARL